MSLYISTCVLCTSLVAQTVKNLPAMQTTWVWPLGWEDPLEKGMATHSSILAWRIPWTEEPGDLQSMESQRFRHNWLTKYAHTYIPTYIYKGGGGWNQPIWFLRPWVGHCVVLLGPMRSSITALPTVVGRLLTAPLFALPEGGFLSQGLCLFLPLCPQHHQQGLTHSVN